MQLTLDNSLEVHEHWINPVRKKLVTNYGDVHEFSERHQIDYLSAFWFFKGNPVILEDFKAICDALKIEQTLIQDPFQIKLLKLWCTYAGFIRAGIKWVETRKTSQVLGKHYRGWVAIASCHDPVTPDWSLIKQVTELAVATYDQEWLGRLDNPDLYKPGHILAIARVVDAWKMTEDNLTNSPLERLVGGWEPGRWAINLQDVIAPAKPIPYKILGQGAIYLNEQHHIYQQIIELTLTKEEKTNERLLPITRLG